MRRYLLPLFGGLLVTTFVVAFFALQSPASDDKSYSAIVSDEQLDIDDDSDSDSDSDGLEPLIEELPIPELSPSVITLGIPTFVTVTLDLSSDPDIKNPKLEFFNTDRGNWTTIKTLNDEAKFGDRIENDRVFHLQLRFLDSGGTTAIHVAPAKPSGHFKLTATTFSPVQLRVAAKKTGQRGIVISSPMAIETIIPSSLTVGGQHGDPQFSIEVPATFHIVDADDPYDVSLRKFGDNGYSVGLNVLRNTTSLPFEEFIIACVFFRGLRPCQPLEPSDPHTLVEYTGNRKNLISTPISVGELSGVQLEHTETLGLSYEIYLDDPINGQVFFFQIVPDSGQIANFGMNLSEAMSIVESLREQ